MAARYWVGGTANWDQASTANWSLTDGGASGAAVPTAADDVFFTASSGSGTVTLTATAPCRSIQSTATSIAFVHNSSTTIQVGDATAGSGNVAVDLSGFTSYTTQSDTASWSIQSTSATQQTVNFNGNTTGAVTFGGASGGNWIYGGGHTIPITRILTHTRGTLNLNGQTCDWGKYLSSNTNTRTLTTGAAAITIRLATTAAWDTATTTNGTFTLTGSTITFIGNTASLIGGAVNFATVNFTTGAGHTITSAGSFVNLSKTGDTGKASSLTLATSVTVSGTFTVNANSDVNRVMIRSDVLGTARTITAGTVVVTNTVNFRDVTGAGAATWTVAGSGATALGDAGGNSGITFSTPATQTATGTASFTWSTHGWTSRVPLPQDDVVINNAFIAGRTVTLDMPQLGKSIDLTGATGSPTLSTNTTVEIYGSLTLISAMTLTFANACTFLGRGSFTITSFGKTFAAQVGISAFGGTYTLQDAFSTPNSLLTISNGTFDGNDFNVTFGTFSIVGSGLTKVINMGNGTWTLRSTATGTPFSIGFATGLTWNAEGSTLDIGTTSANIRTIAGAGQTFNHFTYTIAGSTGGLDMTGSNTWNNFSFSDVTNARTLRFTAGTTTTILGSFDGVVGTAGKLMTISSITAATHTLTKASGVVSCDYLHLTNSIATGGATWFAGANSTDNGGNTGWIFTAATTTSTSSSTSTTTTSTSSSTSTTTTSTSTSTTTTSTSTSSTTSTSTTTTQSVTTSTSTTTTSTSTTTTSTSSSTTTTISTSSSTTTTSTSTSSSTSSSTTTTSTSTSSSTSTTTTSTSTSTTISTSTSSSTSTTTTSTSTSTTTSSSTSSSTSTSTTTSYPFVWSLEYTALN